MSDAYVLKSLLVLHALIPVSILLIFLYQFRVRSWVALWAGVVLGALWLAIDAHDIVRLKRGGSVAFLPRHTVWMVCLCTATYGALAVGTGLHGDLLLLMVATPWLVVAVAGNKLMMVTAWSFTAITLAFITSIQMPASAAAWSAGIFAATFGAFGIVIDMVIRGTAHGDGTSRELAIVASHTGSLRVWPNDLLGFAGHIAGALGVKQFLVADRRGPADPFSVAIAWPDGTKGPPSLDQLATRAVLRRKPVAGGGWLAVPSPASSDGVVLVVPDRWNSAPTDGVAMATCIALLAAMKDRARMVTGMVDMANTDQLTGLSNRHHLFEVLQRELAAAGRNNSPVSVAMLDIDRFKQFNDRYGQAQGDDVLRALADRLRGRLRGRDLASRYGGEEFLVVLPGTDLAGAVVVVEALRAEAATVVPWQRLTLSAGVATWDGSESADELVFRADANLLAAKEAGRDQVASSA